MIILNTNVLSALMRHQPDAAVAGSATRGIDLDHQHDSVRGVVRLGAVAGEQAQKPAGGTVLRSVAAARVGRNNQRALRRMIAQAFGAMHSSLAIRQLA